MEDGDLTRKTFDGCPTSVVGTLPTFSCPGWPTAVVAEKCTGAYYGAKGPCCKMDDAILFVLQSPWWKEIDWFIFSDDDVSVRRSHRRGQT